MTRVLKSTHSCDLPSGLNPGSIVQCEECGLIWRLSDNLNWWRVIFQKRARRKFGAPS